MFVILRTRKWNRNHKRIYPYEYIILCITLKVRTPQMIVIFAISLFLQSNILLHALTLANPLPLCVLFLFWKFFLITSAFGSISVLGIFKYIRCGNVEWPALLKAWHYLFKILIQKAVFCAFNEQNKL